MESYYVLMEFFGWTWEDIYLRTPHKVVIWILKLISDKSQPVNEGKPMKWRGLREHSIYRAYLRAKGATDI